LVYLPKRRGRIARVVCHVCKGTGRVKVKENGEKEISCPRCEGRGFI